ncbi:hypothetical protein [Yersinia phage vB_YenP_ISAO8]|uniref:Uncharacterized protein n=1 Tax=Yersinia phage vB_YenP_ISAO8 TaxID=1675027 RepID=A0A0H4TL24_9CAUD|nr:hypothetical protein AVU16_gp09 [Yersinia phage vB_YenP_ISAO8]AKQ07679.1 hypothetical protein [Yersinia phage vB_YenP_ISAO8]
MGQTSLVHPRTANLPPEEQAQGIYQYTSPEELEARRLSRQQSEPALADRKTEMPAAIAAPYGGKLVRRRTMQPGGTPLVDITRMMVENLPEDDAWQILTMLAKRFDLEVQ